MLRCRPWRSPASTGPGRCSRIVTDFTSPLFAVLLVPLLFALWLTDRSPRLQLVGLLVASYLFYSWTEPVYLLLIVSSSLIDYGAGLAIYRSSRFGVRRALLIGSLSANLGLLGFFKYAAFVADNVNRLTGDPGLLPRLELVLPVGISFYTFQSMSYTIDIYRRTLTPGPFLHFLYYVASFPQLVAGPIVRAGEFLPQLRARFAERVDPRGVFYFLFGLFKKLFIANVLATQVVDPIFADPLAHSSVDLYFGVVCYALQIFFDFSAYSDIAIGVGKLVGLQLPVNFLSPYLATSPREFWRRWHISLSQWIRDYVFIPLGGSRRGTARTYLNSVATMTLFGLWHGAGWNFVLWGLLHGAYQVVWRLVPWLGIGSDEVTGRSIRSGVRLAQRLFFFQCVCLAWILFRAQGLDGARDYLVGLGSNWAVPTVFASQGSLLGLAAVAFVVHDWVEPRLPGLAEAWTRVPLLVQALAFHLLFVAYGYLSVEATPFIYFQF